MSPPQRAIYNDNDLQKFVVSSAKNDLLQLVSIMGLSCSLNTIPYKYNPYEQPLQCLSPCIASLYGSLVSISTSWITDFPPITDTSKVRFGNPSFKLWYQRLQDRSISIIYNLLQYRHYQPTTVLDSDTDDTTNTCTNDFDSKLLQEAYDSGYKAAEISISIESIKENITRTDNEDTCSNTLLLCDTIEELVAYFVLSFGHEVRLDYGTGHECSFQVFLLSLFKLGCFSVQNNVDNVITTSATTATNVTSQSQSTTTPIQQQQQNITIMKRYKAITLSIWNIYLQITRSLQYEYRLEPAGSHGVWGLDDYYCLSFYYGSCQMQCTTYDNVNEYDPSIINNDSIVKISNESNTLLYLSCIQFIKKIKTNVPFYESSSMLYDISKISNWNKVSVGLLRLFIGEVLSKRPVVQHFVFGTLFSADWIPSQIIPINTCPPITELFRTTVTTSISNNTTTTNDDSNTKNDNSTSTTTTATTTGTNTSTTNKNYSSDPTVMTKAPWAK